MKLLCVTFIAVLIGRIEGYTPAPVADCNVQSCYPATGNLLVGRHDKLSATSTCGLEGKSKYCILSHLDRSHGTSKQKKCFDCDSTPESERTTPEKSHRIKNIVYQWDPPGAERKDQYRSWWQSDNAVTNVTIQLDLEAEFHVTHLIIHYKSFRPAAMYIEKSFDWGKTWNVTRYFAADCAETFPGVRKGAPSDLEEVVCQERYSKIVPSTGGTVIYRVLPPNINPSINNGARFNPYSREIQDLLKMTNVRIHMTKLHTMGDENLLETSRHDVREKYYYAIYDMTVRGSCSCYGHADTCLPAKEEDKDVEGMVHGKCDCRHNTMGNNCEYCMDLYNDVPWKPAIGKQKYECIPCKCNNHAEKCHFDPSLFAASGNRTGGVCDDCQHNTEGRNCEYCIEGFYQNTTALDDPDVCQPCDCEPEGTIDDGLCDGYTDEEEETVAGQCHCKDNVGGPRCDKCKNGYWNFTSENPAGCQECNCNINGIVSDDGCDEKTGECTCKRFVIGRDCDQCMPEHYGLSLENPNGCTPCDCDIGGSYDNNCEVTSGQCKCRPKLGGRRCDEVEDGYYTGSLDHLLFEGELALGSINPPTVATKRIPSKDPAGNTWTGFGFMEVREGSTLTFNIPSIFTDMEYDLVVRHEHDPNFPESWDNATVELIRVDGPVNPEGHCKETVDEPITFKMDPDKLYTEIEPPLCLEEGANYELKFTFNDYDQGTPAPTAKILIDSIVLIPEIEGENVQVFDPESGPAQELITTYNDNACRDEFITPNANISDECKDIMVSISMLAFNGGLDKVCKCDPTGSESKVCDKYSGQCPCKKNVGYRDCDSCLPGYWGFGAEGCEPCNCHNIGSLNAFCRVEDGQCDCAENAFGRQCDECEPGYFNFPTCQPCECNGHAATCHPTTGECISCGEFTDGTHCEVCLEGFYGNPLQDVNIPCRPCPCPNTKESGHSFADRCTLDPVTLEPICECYPEYAGNKCDVCEDNYFGNPEIPGGSCKLCNCSDNWKEDSEGNCDSSTGVCLQCIYNTEGDHCEYCEPGYYGDAVNDVCKACVCDLLGTDPNQFDCDRFTGDCHCLTNVEGKSCDRCIDNHWGIARGEGCEPCACDMVGSLSESCNVFDGQCECKDGFGGRQCNECQENYYGDPQVECFPCDCNPRVSESLQCDRVTGKCICREGIGGEKCDECARGYVQRADLSPDHPVLNKTIPYGADPDCIPCGECFSNWDRILTNLETTTKEEVVKAEIVKVTGATGAYTRFFEEMEEKLQEIKDILAGASISNDELSAVQNEIDAISGVLTTTTEELDGLDSNLADTKQAILQAKATLEFLKADADRRQMTALEMKEKITSLQESNVEGALTLTQEALEKSQNAKQKVELVSLQNGFLTNSEVQRKATESLMDKTRTDFQSTQSQNQGTLDNIITQIENLEERIPELNKQVCDGETTVDEPCDSLCGGAGCGKCGGISCLSGALSKAEEAVKSAESADKLLVEKERSAEQVLLDISKAHSVAEAAASDAQAAFDLSKQAKDRSEGELDRSTELAVKIDAFTSDDKASAEDVQSLADECLEAQLNLGDGEIQALAVQINNAIVGVPDVEQILADTADDLEIARALKTRAESVRDEAIAQREVAENVTRSLSEAAVSQDAAEIAVTQTRQDIDSARSDLGQIQNDMSNAVGKADSLVYDVTELMAKQRKLQADYITNENRVKLATDAAIQAKTQADKANTELYQVNNGFRNVSGKLEIKGQSIGGAKDLALDLQKRANNLANFATNKISVIREIEKEYEDNESKFNEMSKQLINLNCEMLIHLQVIEELSNFHRTCTPPTTWNPSNTCTCDPGSMQPTCQSRRDVSFNTY